MKRTLSRVAVSVIVAGSVAGLGACSAGEPEAAPSPSSLAEKVTTLSTIDDDQLVSFDDVDDGIIEIVTPAGHPAPKGLAILAMEETCGALPELDAILGTKDGEPFAVTRAEFEQNEGPCQ